MEVGTELSVQIKKAIKAKLQEMQCYVDDELPDYIMVMIANKKTTQQMADDLKIFLSEKSVTFCEWLGEVLERLDKVGDDSANSKQEKEKKSEKSQETSRKARSRSASAKRKTKGSPKTTRSRSKSAARVEKRSYKDSTKPNYNSSSSSRRAIVDSDSSSAKKRPKKIEEKKQIVKQKSLTPRRRKKRSDSRTGDMGARGSERKSPEVRKRPIIADKEDSDEVLDKRHFVPEFKKTGTKIVIKNEYNQEQEEDKKEVTAAVPDDPLRDASPLSSDENEHLLAESPEPVSEKEKSVVLNSAVFTKSHSIKGHPQRLSARDRIVTGPKKTGIVRPLVVVSNRSQSDLRERLEQRHQRKVSSVSKRTSTRRLDRNLSNLNTIFSKALQEVTTLEISSEKHEEYDPLEPDIPETKGRLRMDIMSIPRVTVQNENAEVEILRLAAKKSRRTAGKKKRTSENSNSDSGSRSPKREASGGESGDERKRVILSETSPDRVERSKNTKFVVSLRGASKFLDKLVKPGDISEDELSNSDKESTKSEKANAGVNDADSNCNDVSSTNDSPVKNLKLIDYESSVTATEKNVSEVAEEASRERCKFWPNCKQRDQCAYVHPTKPCAKFPQCPFGDNCLFVHPQCRFAASCTNASCYYSHPKNRSRKRPLSHTSPYAVPPGSLGSKVANSKYMPVASSGDVTCKYGAQCKSSNCPFLHPKYMKDCAFGVSCRRKSTGCKYLHGVGMAKFKWSKSLDTCGKRNAMPTSGTTKTAIETK